MLLRGAKGAVKSCCQGVEYNVSNHLLCKCLRGFEEHFSVWSARGVNMRWAQRAKKKMPGNIILGDGCTLCSFYGSRD